jgi:hypothetical protein
MSSSTLFRLSGLAGILCGLVILTQRLIIDTVAPGNPIAIGPLGPILGLLIVTGVYLRQREESGVLGGVAFVVAFISLGFVEGIDFTRRYILVQLDPLVVQALVAGPVRLLFLACGVSFLVGVLLFGLTTFRAGIFPRAATLLYVIGFIPYSVPVLFPAEVVTLGQATGAVGIAWLGWTLWHERPAVSIHHTASPEPVPAT